MSTVLVVGRVQLRRHISASGHGGGCTGCRRGMSRCRTTPPHPLAPSGACTSVAIRDAKGLRYLRLLVGQPGVEISSLDLATWVSGHAGGVAADAPVDDIIDRTA